MASGPDEVLRNEELPALFWDELPDDPNNPDVAAIKAIIEESTPEERAESFKVGRMTPRSSVSVFSAMLSRFLLFSLTTL